MAGLSSVVLARLRLFRASWSPCFVRSPSSVTVQVFAIVGSVVRVMRCW